MSCPSPAGLKKHMFFKHSSEKPYSCNLCNYRSVKFHFRVCFSVNAIAPSATYIMYVHLYTVKSRIKAGLIFTQAGHEHRLLCKTCLYANRLIRNNSFFFETPSTYRTSTSHAHDSDFSLIFSLFQYL